MICPYCSANNDKVIDSRSSEGGAVIRRRRQCLGCERRFTTYERIEDTMRLVVIKKDGSREPFAREKILKGVLAACGKRPVPENAKLRIVEEIEEQLHHAYDREVEARVIGEMVAQHLRDLDDIAYIRYASEYYQFGNTDELHAQLEEMRRHVKDVKGQQTLLDQFQATLPKASAPKRGRAGA